MSRLRSDCEYFLNKGQHEEKHLWAGSVEKQIAKMRELYQLLPEKPEWITEQDIDRYEQQMTGAIPEPDKIEPRYTVTQTTDAFEDPFALWDHQTDEYYRDAYGDIPTFMEESEAAAYLEGLTGVQPARQEPELDKAAAPAPDNRVEIDGGSIGLRSIVIDLTGQSREEKEEPEQAQQSERLNFHITDEQLGVGGQKTKYQNNVAAIRTLKQIETEGRLATS